MELLLIGKEGDYVCIKILIALGIKKQCIKIKELFAFLAQNALAVKKYQQFVDVCLKINCKEASKMPEKCNNVKLTGDHRQFKAPFDIYANSEFILK